MNALGTKSFKHIIAFGLLTAGFALSTRPALASDPSDDNPITHSPQGQGSIGIHPNSNHVAPSPCADCDVPVYPQADTYPSSSGPVVYDNYPPPPPPASTPVYIYPPAGMVQNSTPMETENTPEVNLEESNQIFSVELGAATGFSRIHLKSGLGGSGDNGDTGLLWGARFLYYTTPQLGFGMDYEHFHRSAASSSDLLRFADTSVSGDSHLLLGIAKFTLTTSGSVRPYLLGGIGVDRTSTQIDATPAIGYSWADTDTWETRRIIDDTQTGLAATARAGLDFGFSSSRIFSLELGWTEIFNRDAPATFAGKQAGITGASGDLHGLVLAAKLGWRF